jgi:DNA repair exonuclease SbcCD nuclease subunit
MKTLIIPDFHYGRYTNKSVEEGLLSVQKQIIDTCIKYGIDEVIFVGDLVRKKDLQKMDLQVLFEVKKYIIDLWESANVKVLAISGNHDQFTDNFIATPSNSVIDLLPVRNIDNEAYILDTDKQVVTIGIPFYREGSEFMEMVNKIKFFPDSYPREIILICHQTPKGSGYESSDVVDFELPIFREFNKIYCGHIHEPKEFLNVIQTGACLAYKRNEQSQKYLYIFDTETMENESIKIDFQVQYDNTEIQTIKKDTQLSNRLKAKESVFDIEKEIETYSNTQDKKEKVLEYGKNLYNKNIKSTQK